MNIQDYVQQNIGGVVNVLASVWVRLTNNASGNTYVSASVTDGNGLFQINNIPAGMYTMATGPSAIGPWTNTGDNNYEIAPSFNTVQTPTFVSPLIIDASAGQIVVVGILTGNITIGVPTFPTTGQQLTLQFTQDSVGNRTVTFNAIFKTAWIVNPGPNRISSVTFFYDGTNWQQQNAASVDDTGVSIGRFWDYGGMSYNVKAFGAKGDGKQLNAGAAASNGTISAASAVLTSVSNPWTSSDVNKLIYVPGAGVAGLPLITTIASYQSAGQVTLSVAASTSVTTANVSWATDDSAAILATVNAAAATVSASRVNRNAVSFPPGIYGIASSAVLTPTNTTTVRAGMHYQGSGKHISVLQLYPTAGTDIFYYDNVATPRIQFSTFSDIGFWGMNQPAFSTYSDIPANSKGFRIWATSASGAHEQNFKFRSCYFWGLGEVYETQGDNTASEIGWVQCQFAEILTQFALINNLQSFDHEFYNCDWIDLYGHGFNIGANGGGAVKTYGGSAIMQSKGTTDTYWWYQPGAPVNGLSANPNVFDGLKFELLGNYTNLVLIGDRGQQWINFEKSQFYTTSTLQKAAWVSIVQQGHVHFLNCGFLEVTANTMQFICAGNTTSYGIDGEIGFDKCDVPIDWSDRCSVTNVGHIWGRHLMGTNIGALGAGVHYAHDFDLRNGTVLGQVGVWLGDGTVKNSASLTHTEWTPKVAVLKLEAEQWPLAAGSEQTLKLPKGAYIKGIHIRKPPRGGDGNLAQLQVTNNGKTVVHVLTTQQTWGPNAFIGDVDNYFYCVGDTVGERTLRLSIIGTPGQTIYGGIAIVEYY